MSVNDIIVLIPVVLVLAYMIYTDCVKSRSEDNHDLKNK
jgi:uncharacterized membrane protein YobD (UPF0266 family)